MSYTASKMKNLIKCASYENSSNEAPNFEAERGSIIHALLNNIDINIIIEKGTEYRGVYSPLKFQHDFNKYLGIVKQVKIQTLNTIDVLAKISQEENIKTEINGEILEGILDLLVIQKNGLFVFDWKTGRTRYNALDVIDSIQSVIYTYLACVKYDFNKAVFVYVYIDEDGVESVDKVERTKTECEDIIVNWLHKIITEKEAGIKNVNDACQYCKHNRNCNEMNTQVAIFETHDILDISKEDVKKMKAIIKVMEKLIDKYKQTAPESEFYYKKMYYIDTNKLSIEEKLKLVKDKVSITKDEIVNYNEEQIEERLIKVMK
jgi:hypothetical protein